MFDLQALSDSQKALNSRNELKVQESHLLCSKGTALLALAEMRDYDDRELVKQGCHLLMDAIALHRPNVEAYLQLARIFLVFREDDKALSYVQSAREYDPDHEEVQNMLHFLQNPSPESPEVDYDALHQDIQQQLDAHLAFLDALQIDQLAKVSGQLPAMENALEKTLAVEADIREKIEALDQEMDVHHLDRALGRMAHYSKQLARYVKGGDQLQRVQERIVALQKQVQTYLRKQIVSDVFTRLEHLLDQCDLMADDLDVLEKSGLDITYTEHDYDMLVTLVTRFQEKIDDANV